MNTYNEVQELDKCLGLLKNRGMSVPSLTQSLKLKAKTKALATEGNQLRIEVLKKYGVEEKDGTYTWSNHPQFEEINKDIDELFLRTDVGEIAPIKFLTMKELVDATTDLPLGIIVTLQEWLVKE